MSMVEQHFTLLVLLDLSAAFDTIYRDKLIGRLESDLGITDNALAWFKSYLSDHFQRVSVNGSLSDQFPLKQGVPQGSCSGPLLFTIYTRKLFQIVERHLPQVHIHTHTHTHTYTHTHTHTHTATRTIHSCMYHSVPVDLQKLILLSSP